MINHTRKVAESRRNDNCDVDRSKSGKPAYRRPELVELGNLKAVQLAWHGYGVDGTLGYYNPRIG